ncbi:MAG: DNA-processing protein DprA [Bauldia sp.]|nr:DNA-processing protein DprA [Bauldia sp.]
MTAGRGGPALQLSDRQRLAWLRLIRSENVGPVTFRELINHFGSGEAALAAAPELARRGGRSIRICAEAEAEQEVEALRRRGGRFVAMGEADYPDALRHVADAPPLISVIGDTVALSRPMVAIVGSRNASVAGRKFASMVARGLGEAGYVVASGLARGIDGAAHEAALATGTVAVLAGGLSDIYPPEHADLAARIASGGGALIGEMPFGHEPRGRDFPRRNRIISGVSLAVVVIEAAERSGSLITARRAADQGRLVFAAPGSPLDPRAAGSNRLIKDGALMATTAEDVIAEIDPMRGRIGRDDVEEPEGEPIVPGEVGDDERARVLEALGPTPVEIDEIIRFARVRPAVVHLVLLELALAGRLERHPGQRVSMV